ncbi:hypothetical protein C8Q79DRAFT_1011817 [Trametes meyenii]|nr:hypothetical protein C8Q79DRAFT_1011817 [Trametes meyenii]
MSVPNSFSQKEPDPVPYSPSVTAQTSPHKFQKDSNRDPSKHGYRLTPKARLDRALHAASSMGHTVLIDLKDFVRDVQITTDPAPRSFSEREVDAMRFALQSIFKGSVSPSEDQIAESFVNALNKRSTCRGYVAKLSRYRYQKNDPSRAKVDAALYRTCDVPPDEGVPGWAHIRLYIEFKKGGTGLDPFDDDNPDYPEASADRRVAARAQLIAYTHNVFLYQHRDALHSLFVNGREFRILRWDRSGVIATKKHDYVKDPRPLLEFLAYFESLSDVQQGIDCTATPLAPTSKAYKLMDDFAQANQSDMPHAEKTEIPPLKTVSSPPAPPASPSPVLAADQATTTDTPTPATYQGPTFGTRQKTKQAVEMHPDTPVVPDETDPPQDDDSEGYLDEIEEPEGAPERVFQYVRDKFRASIDPELGWPRYKIEVGEERRPFLVGKPNFFSTLMFGRGTRGYVALDVKARRFVFLKDSWRPFYAGVEREDHYLELLTSNPGVSIDVPRLVAHGDVSDHYAFTTLYAEHLRVKELAKVEGDGEIPATPSSSDAPPSPTPASSVIGQKRAYEDIVDPATDAETHVLHADGGSLTESESGAFRHHRHYRVVVLDVCLPFTEIVSSTQLVRLIYDCIYTHSLAYEHYSVLHRDISAGNVIIRPQLKEIEGRRGWNEVIWTGILTDWELAKVVPKDGSKQTAKQPERTGTWQFMSVAYVRDHPTPVAVADELESFFHVMLFYAVRLIRTNIQNVEAFVVDYFDSYRPGAGRFGRVCSDTKTSIMRWGTLSSHNVDIDFYLDEEHENKKLNDLLNQWLDLFRARYAAREWERQSAKQHESKSVGTSLESGKRPRPRPPIGPRDQAAPTVPEATAEQRYTRDKEIAKRLNKHTFVMYIIYDALTVETPGASWPDNDVIPDKFPETYDPRETLLAIDHLVASTMGVTARSALPRKRARTQASSERSQPEAGFSKQVATATGSPTRGKKVTGRNPRGKVRHSLK